MHYKRLYLIEREIPQVCLKAVSLTGDDFRRRRSQILTLEVF